MRATEILDTFKGLGITAYIKGDSLVCEPGSRLPSALKPEIRVHKAEIMALLDNIQPEVPTVPAPLVSDGGLPPLDRPPETEMELRRLIDYLGDPTAFAQWFQKLMEHDE